MIRRYPLIPLFCLLCGFLTAADRPNVVVILSDDQGWGDLSLHGNTNLETPNLDQLASEGTRFEHFYVQPVCSPTRAEFLTGRSYPRSGVYSTSQGGERMDTDETTVADVFKAAGYRTAAFGKWHNGMQYPYHPNARGFEEFYGYCSGHWGSYMNPMLEQNGALVRGNGFLTDDLTEHAMDFITEHRKEPFFVYLPLNIPHSPMQVTERWWERFRDKDLALRATEPENEDLDHSRAALALCENIDWNVGRLLAHLERLNLSKDTIVVYFSDNGPNGWRWNGGMKGIKGSVDEGGVRSPLFIRWPERIPAGESIESIAGAIDLMPTLVDLAGIQAKALKPFDGQSLRPMMEKKEHLPDSRLLFAHWSGRTSVRSQRFRMMDQGALYDLENDPTQTKDVTEAFPEVAGQLRDALRQWKTEVLSEMPQAGTGHVMKLEDTRPFPVGHPGFRYTQLPARDAQAEGGLVRSNHYPNCTFYTGWKSTEDLVFWNVEVLASGKYRAEVYYTCPEKDLGSTVELSFGGARVQSVVKVPNDPPLEGMELDRVPRQESYVKDFIPLDMGVIELPAGKGQMRLQATDIPGAQAMDFRLLMLTRVE